MKVNYIDTAAQRCGHDFCGTCLAAELGGASSSRTAHSFPCPGQLPDGLLCGQTVKQKTLRGETSLAEQEALRHRDKRRLVQKVRNRDQDSFETLEHFNAYQAESEDLVYALLALDGAELAEAEAHLAAYKQENDEQIAMAESRKASRRAEERTGKTAHRPPKYCAVAYSFVCAAGPCSLHGKTVPPPP